MMSPKDHAVQSVHQQWIIEQIIRFISFISVSHPLILRNVL